MYNWRIAWAYLTSRFCPPLYRRWQFSRQQALSWSALPGTVDLEPELLLLPEFLERPGRFLDVGANLGHYVHAALRRKPASEVVAVEPIPRLCGLLARAFPGLPVVNQALTDSEGDRMLKIPDIGGRRFFTRATLNVDYEEPGESGRQLIRIAAGPLDALWDRLGDPPLACVKIDTEGHEMGVLAGGLRTFARHRPVLLVEIEQRHHREDIAAVVDFVRGEGYACWHFDRALPGLRRLDVAPSSLQRGREGTPGYVNNFFFLPDGDSAAEATVDRINRRLAASRPVPANR